MSDGIFLSDFDRRRHEQKQLAQDYLMAELPGFKSYIEFTHDPSGISIHVRSAIPFGGRMDQALLPMRMDMNGDVMKSGVDKLIERTRDDAIQMLGLAPHIEKRAEEAAAREFARRQAEIERVAYERGLEAGINLTLRARRDADEALDRIEGGSE